MLSARAAAKILRSAVRLLATHAAAHDWAAPPAHPAAAVYAASAPTAAAADLSGPAWGLNRHVEPILRQLADSLDTEAAPDPLRRLTAWAAFADVSAIQAAMCDLIHRLDPVRMPIGWLTINPRRHDLIALAHRTVIATSGGKDSVVLEDIVCRHAAAKGRLHTVVAIHNDLGVTDSGEPVEWPGLQDLVRRQTARHGIRLEITRRERGGLFQQLTHERRKFPSSSARWCTSDQKTAQALKVVTRLVDEVRTQEGIDHVIVLYCVGLRAAESPARAQKPEFAIDRTASNSRRTVIRWHPILHHSTREIWQYIRDHGLEYHWAYDAGARRLSCRLCVLATRSDLVCAARTSPEIVQDYVAAERELGHTFQHGLSMAEIQTEAERLGPITHVEPGAALERELSTLMPGSVPPAA